MKVTRMTASAHILNVTQVPPRRRLALSVLCGALAAMVTISANHNRSYSRDFGQVWFAARALTRGKDPYQLIGPGRAFEWPAPHFYPLTAAVVAMPLAPLPEGAASVLFSSLAGGVFAWALMEFGYAPLFGFFGASTHFAFELAQWSPLFAASIALPPLGIALVAKPTIGTAMFLTRPNTWAVFGGLAILGIAFAIQPDWVPHWRQALAGTSFVPFERFPYRAPVLMPGGILMLACLSRWRRPEARLIAALACVPQTLMLYETVPLFLVPRSFRESAVLVAASYVVFYSLEAMLPGQRDLHAYLELSGQLIVLALYLPVTFMVLRRPNVGPLPARLERLIASWPAWLRGAQITA